MIVLWYQIDRVRQSAKIDSGKASSWLSQDVMFEKKAKFHGFGGNKYSNRVTYFWLYLNKCLPSYIAP